MSLTYTIDIKADHVACEVSGRFTPEEGLRALLAVLDACALSGHMAACIDVTGIKHTVGATDKAIWAYRAENAVERFSSRHRTLPRIAIFGTTPFVTEYKPASDHFQRLGIPTRVFDDRRSAEGWLFGPDT